MNPQSTRITLLLIFLALSSIACAKTEPPKPIYTKVLPNSGVVTSNGIRPHSMRYEKSKWAMNYTMQEAEVDGEAMWLVEVEFNPGPDSKPDKIWLDESTLAFRKRLLQLTDYTIDVSMKDAQFSGNLTPAEGSDYTPVIYDKRYEHDAFEPAIINYAISILPLTVGYTASIPVIDLNDGSQLFWSNIKVIASEVVTIDGVEFDCWKVASDGIRKKTIWISKKDLLTVKMATSGNLGSWKIVPSSIKY